MRFLIAIFLLFSLPVQALEVTGAFTQGGFLFGQTEPGAKVKVGKLNVPVAKDGQFVVGLGRHAEAEVKVVATLLSGKTKEQVVLIEPRTYKTQHIKGVKKKHVTPMDPKDLAQIKSDKEQILLARAKFAAFDSFKQQFALPVSGTITGVYGSRRTYNGKERNWHKGLDIANKTGTPVYAPADGEVRLALDNSFFNGNLIILDHGHQFITIYAHLDSMDVAAKQQVKQGDLLGKVGTTGRSTGPHLHWGLYWRNMALDPSLLLKGNNETHP